MKLIKRCYSCGKRIYPWQDITYTKLVGKIHKGCAFSATVNYQIKKELLEYTQHLEEEALKALNKEETK